MYTCAKCSKTQPLSNFHKDSSAPKGHHSHCKLCRAATLRRRKQRPEEHLGRPQMGQTIVIPEMGVQGVVKACQASLKQSTEIAFWVFLEDGTNWLCDNSPNAEPQYNWEIVK